MDEQERCVWNVWMVGTFQEIAPKMHGVVESRVQPVRVLPPARKGKMQLNHVIFVRGQQRPSDPFLAF